MKTQDVAVSRIDDLLHKAEDLAKREPAKAVGSAVGAGIILNLLPIGAIVGLFTTLALSLVRPLLLVLGLYKAVELVQSRSQSTESAAKDSSKESQNKGSKSKS